MKRVGKALLAALLVVGIVMTCAFANELRGRKFVDTDDNGVCDNQQDCEQKQDCEQTQDCQQAQDCQSVGGGQHHGGHHGGHHRQG